MHVIEEVHRVCDLDLEPYVILISLKRTLIKDLQPSHLTDYKYYLEGGKEVCTRGTRTRLLKNIVAWAEGTSSETIYWLFGPAGSGKSTIAYTIARRFELAAVDDPIVLGGNFMCSRLFEETKSATRIVRTIVYQLALKCKPFADALMHSGKYDTINQSPRDQLESLLIEPWQASQSTHLANLSTTPRQYLIVIDALDELGGTGGSEFLRDILGVINGNRLKGLKFLATSRPDPALFSHADDFGDKHTVAELSHAGFRIKTLHMLMWDHTIPPMYRELGYNSSNTLMLHSHTDKDRHGSEKTKRVELGL